MFGLKWLFERPTTRPSEETGQPEIAAKEQPKDELVADYCGSACLLTPGCLHGLKGTQLKNRIMAGIKEAADRGVLASSETPNAWAIARCDIEPEAPPSIDLEEQIRKAAAAERRLYKRSVIDAVAKATDNFKQPGVIHEIINDINTLARTGENT